VTKPVKYLYVYILKCSDRTYYTGITNNPDQRFLQHMAGVNPGCYTYSRRPLEMVYCERFADYTLAIEWEKRINNWSKKKKEALINNDWESLKKASECQNETNHKHPSRLRSK
jgi:putative endonuclease